MIHRQPASDRVLRAAEHGNSVLEVTIALAAAAVILGAVTAMLMSSVDVYAKVSTSSDLEGGARRVLSELTGELADSGADLDGTEHVLSHPRTAATTGALVTFERRVALTGVAAADWSDPVTYRLAPSAGEDPTNGIDDDGDLLVDEQRLVRQSAGGLQTLTDGVLSLQFDRELGVDVIDVTLTLGRWDTASNQLTARTIATVVALRNRE